MQKNKKDININLENHNHIEKRMRLLSEQKNVVAHELAFSICNGVKNMPDVLASIRECSADMSISDKVSLCFAVYDFFEQKNLLNFKHEFLPSISEPVPADALNKIAYMKSNYTDRAFGVFSSAIRTNRAVLVNSFALACEEVISGNCEFALLPLENSSDGILYSFYSLIENNGLNIFTTCEITDIYDDFKATRFALVCKNPTNATQIKNRSRYFEFLNTLYGNISTSDILIAAKLCGMRLVMHNSLPVVYKTEEYTDHFIFCAKDAFLDVFLLFLSVFAKDYISLGIYAKTSQNKNSD